MPHTPGPWTVRETQRGTMIYGAVDGGPVARIERVSDRENPNASDEANARLIAAAPEMRVEHQATIDAWTLLGEGLNTISDNLAHWSHDQVRIHLGQLQNIVNNRDRRARALLARIGG